MSGPVFTDGLCQRFESQIREKAAKGYPGRQIAWVKIPCRGPTGKSYLLRRLAIIQEHTIVIAIARLNRSGAVHWSPSIPAGATIEAPVAAVDAVNAKEAG